MITLTTNFGDIKISLDKENTPNTAKNFLAYVNSDFFENTLFHRVIPGFMIQCGGFSTDMEQKQTKEPIENEADKSMPNKRGTIAMARTNDPHSATAQFFINLKDNAFLDFKAKNANGWGYCVFGEVTDGMDVVDKIATMQTTSKAGHQDVPVENIVIEKVVIDQV